MNKTFIIAEAGVNHNGRLDLALKLVDAAAFAGVDAIKFQTWKTELLLTRGTELAEYQKASQENNSQFDMLKKLELTYFEFSQIKTYCDKKNIMFLSTPDEIESAKFLDDLQDIFKIGSGEITNLPLLTFIGGLKKQIIISTGMSNLEEIQDALNILINSGTKKDRITVLHCNTEYPTPFEDVNLNAMVTMQNKLGVKIGYSDHTTGIVVPIGAVSLGASVIEKHFTLDKSMEGPDHKASLEPNELKKMVEEIRIVEKSLGNGIKEPSFSEKKNINIVRKSIVAAKTIHKGDVFTKHNISTKRPATGISPMDWDKLIGTTAHKNYLPDDLIELK